MPSFKIMIKENFIWNNLTQEYYFYFMELYKQNELNDDILYILFNNKIKYINMAKNKKFPEGLEDVGQINPALIILKYIKI